jgi:hypothetical protein
VPDLTVGNGVVHLLGKFFGVIAGIEQTIILPYQFVARVLADIAKSVWTPE